MIDKNGDERRHAGLEARDHVRDVWRESPRRIIGLPERSEPAPLRMRVKRLSDRHAELDAKPWHGMGILDVQAKDKRTWKAHDAHEAECRTDAEACNRPQIRQDLGDPALP